MRCDGMNQCTYCENGENKSSLYFPITHLWSNLFYWILYEAFITEARS